MRLIVVFTLLVSTLVSGSIVFESHDRVRRQLYGNQPTILPPLDGYTRQGVPVVKSSYGDSKHVDTTFDGRKDLEHYRDFVNDPWVNTEDLGQIIQTRDRPELRSGRGSVDDEIWTQRRQQYIQQHQQRYPPRQQQQHEYQQYQQQQRVLSPNPTSSTWSRVPEPSYRRSGENSRGRSQTRDPNALSGQVQTQTRSLTGGQNTNKHFENGNAWWEVESRGNDHITYRKRQRHSHSQGYRPYDVIVQPNYQTNTYTHNTKRNEEAALLRQMGQGNGQVLARVVDLRSGNEQIVRNNQRQHSGANTSGGSVSYQPTRTHRTETESSRTWRTLPEPRSLDSTTSQSQGQRQGQVREGNWVRDSSSDSHVTWRKIGSTGGSGSESSYNSNAYRHGSRTRESWTVRPTTPHVPNYPIMNDRVTAEKTANNGRNIMV